MQLPSLDPAARRKKRPTADLPDTNRQRGEAGGRGVEAARRRWCSGQIGNTEGRREERARGFEGGGTGSSNIVKESHGAIVFA